MIDRIVIFTGSKKDFQKFLDDQIPNNSELTPFMDMIQHYNAKLRPADSAHGDNQVSSTGKRAVTNCIVRSDDYASVLEHALSNFVNILTLNNDIENLFVNNPPKRVEASLRAVFNDTIEYVSSKYNLINRTILRTLYDRLQSEIKGQHDCKKKIVSSIYQLTSNDRYKPVVLLLYGPSGVGKTETAKSISAVLGGELTRIQFSMMQSQEAYNYIFGSDHSRSCFARDLISRESNVVLIDEFDKVNPLFYNAFYELFDEGHFEDTNYRVDLHGCIFLCTANFQNESEVTKILGHAMFSRIGSCIAYTELTDEEKTAIISEWYSRIIDRIKPDEKRAVMKTDILSWFIKNANRFDNIRILKTKMENAIFDHLADVFIFDTNPAPNTHKKLKLIPPVTSGD